MTSRRLRTSGFSFIEVMVALMILSLSLVILMGSQGQSMNLISRARTLDQAVMLASWKMSELSLKAETEGLESLKETGQGEFEKEETEGFGWRYTVAPVPKPNFKMMLGMLSDSEEAQDSDLESSNASLFEGPLKAIEEAWAKSLYELRVEVFWGPEKNERTYQLVTHVIEPAAMGQLQGLIGAITGGRSSEEDAQ